MLSPDQAKLCLNRKDSLLSYPQYFSPAMGLLTPDQRDRLYIQQAQRAGIHKSILAALHQTQNQPQLPDGETGLGISPAHQVSLPQVNHFVSQVAYAASTIRQLIRTLMAEDWSSIELWDGDRGRYTDRFLETIANGYLAPASDPTAARLEACDSAALKQSYLADWAIDHQAANLTNLSFLGRALRTFIEQLPRYYLSLTFQREALLELLRIWQQTDTWEAAIAALPATEPLDDITLDRVLLGFVQQIPQAGMGYPHQREALLRLVQRWRQLDSREAAIASLQIQSSPEPSPAILDAALIALVQRLPQTYEGRGDQRHALVEGLQQWQQLDSRAATLTALGVNPAIFAANPNAGDLETAAILVDRALLRAYQQLPTAYTGSTLQRESLLQVVQLWRGLPTREQTLVSLLDDLKRMEYSGRGNPDAMPLPAALMLPAQPDRWSPANLQPFAPIVPNGSLIWADATQGGIHLPTNQTIVDAIVQIATLAQQVCDRLGRPLRVVQWYQPSPNTSRTANRHSLGDAILGYCEGLTALQLYWFLDPWWTGGLGRYQTLPDLIYLDAARERSRWTH
jgi:hypothetical protein